MGESGADDADDGSYPPAPLPAHERRWRHPSELGAADWIVTEPPIALGRGLMITTGAIGCVLGLAILWLLVPTNGDAPVAATTDLVRARTAGAELATTLADELRATLPSMVVSTLAQLPAATAEIETPTFVLPAEDVTANTVRLPEAPGAAGAAVAVVVEQLGVMVTTAAAVEVGTRIEVLPASGEPMEVEVVGVDGAFAYLAAAEPPGEGFGSWDDPVEGATLTILGDDTISFTYGEALLADVVAAAGVAEGAPVVDADGDLVGLCTHARGALEVLPIGSVEGLVGDDPPTSSDRPSTTSVTVAPVPGAAPSTVPVAPASTTVSTPVAGTPSPSTSAQATTTTGATSTAAPATTAAPTTSAAAPQAWVGVRLGGVEGSPALAITAIDTGSPAQLAGLAIGDQIVAVDGTAVTTADQVTALVRAKRPGDPLAITVVPAAAPAGAATTTTTAKPATRTVTVVLGMRGSTV